MTPLGPITAHVRLALFSLGIATAGVVWGISRGQQAPLPPISVQFLSVPTIRVALQITSAPPAAANAWEGIAVSTENARTMAAWAGETLVVTQDGGARWTWLYLASRVVAVTVDGDGWVHVLREGTPLVLLAIAPDGDVRMTPTRLRGPIAWFVSGGGALAVLADPQGEHETYAVSRDHGRTWTLPAEKPSAGNFANDARLDADGTLWTMAGHEASCGGGYQERSRGDLEGGAFERVEWGHDAPTTWWVVGGGWAYAVDETIDGARHLVGEGPAEGNSLVGPVIGDRVDVQVIGNGRVTYAILARKLHVVEPQKLSRAIDGWVPETLARAVVDGDGRLFGLAEGRIMRFTRGIGWEVMVPR